MVGTLHIELHMNLNIELHMMRAHTANIECKFALSLPNKNPGHALVWHALPIYLLWGVAKVSFCPPENCGKRYLADKRDSVLGIFYSGRATESANILDWMGKLLELGVGVGAKTTFLYTFTI